MSIWEQAITTPAREFTAEEEAAMEHVLDVAQGWANQEIPLSQALAEGGGMNPHRARGLALRFRRSDPRLPDLERLSYEMSAANGKTVFPDGTMLPTHVWNQNEWLIEQARRNGIEYTRRTA